MTDQNGKKKKAGRPGRDWDNLFGEWVKSGMDRRDFLASKGISPLSGSALRNTLHWDKTLREQADKLHAQAGGLISRTRHAVVDNVVKTPDGAAPPPDEQVEAAAAVASPVSVDRSSWQRIVEWRSRQSSHDWRTSDTIRLHIGLMLKAGLQPVTVTDQQGNVTNEYRSTLKPSDIRQLAMAAADVQRIQRLALGMSTDNIGIDTPSIQPAGDPTAPAAAEGEAKPANLFIVQLTKGGRFVNARPRRAS